MATQGRRSVVQDMLRRRREPGGRRTGAWCGSSGV